MHRKVQLVVSGGIRSGADVAKALALGADAVSIGVAAMIALGDNAPELEDELRADRLARPATTTTGTRGAIRRASRRRTPSSPARFDPELGGRRLANYLRTMTLESQTLARACGKSHVHNLEPEDLVALTIEAAAMARVPLAGTSWIPGCATAEFAADRHTCGRAATGIRTSAGSSGQASLAGRRHSAGATRSGAGVPHCRRARAGARARRS